MIKIGDFLYCYNNDAWAIGFTIGKKYDVKHISVSPFNNDVIILNTDTEGGNFFYMEYDDLFYYKKYFYTEQEYRKLKIEKINEKV